MTGDDAAPGRDSILAAFRAVYGGQPAEYRVPPPGTEQPPLHGIAAYRGEAHWHLVTVGLAGAVSRAERGAPAVAPAAPSAPTGAELTVLTPPSERPPDWAFALLEGVAKTVRAAGRPLHAGARLAPGEPVDGAGSGLVALGVREDPLVAPAAPASGRPAAPNATDAPPPATPAAYLQVVGVTAGEFGVMRKVGTDLVLAKLAERDPLLRTDPARA